MCQLDHVDHLADIKSVFAFQKGKGEKVGGIEKLMHKNRIFGMVLKQRKLTLEQKLDRQIMKVKDGLNRMVLQK